LKEILIVRLGAMGDIIHALPGATSLKQSYPNARLTWVMDPRWVPLLEGSGLVDRFIGFNRRDYGSWHRTLRELQDTHYDLAVDFQGLFKSAVVGHLAKPERFVGFASRIVREKVAGLFYSSQVDSTSAHVVDQALDLAVGAGARAGTERQFPLAAGHPEGSLPVEPFVLASPLAGWKSKQWPLEYYAKLASLVRERLGMPVVLNGAPGSVPVVPDTTAHESGIAGLIDATRRASLVVGVDSGPLHLAAALGKAGAAIFGPTDPHRNGPYGGDFAVFRKEGTATTHRRGSMIDESMKAITPEQVLAALEARLKCHA
jgi:heptosyltransferase-1